MTEEVERGAVGSFWHRGAEFQDGRSSQAMAALVNELAERGTDGQPVEMVAMDGPWVAPGSVVPLEYLDLLEQPRDELMASNLLQVMDPDATGVHDRSGWKHAHVNLRLGVANTRFDFVALVPDSRESDGAAHRWAAVVAPGR